MRKIIITPLKLDESLSTLSSQGILYLPRVLDSLQLASLECEDQYITNINTPTASVNINRFIKFGKIIESYMKYVKIFFVIFFFDVVVSSVD
jgi:hypothetical protein